MGLVYLPSMAANPTGADDILSKVGENSGRVDAYWLDPLGQLVDRGGPYDKASLTELCQVYAAKQ